MPSQPAVPAAFRANYDALLELGHEMLGFDPMIIFNLSLLVGAVAAFVHYAWGSVYKYAKKVCLSSVHINEDDQLYGQVMRYMADHRLGSKRFRSVKATTPMKSTWEDEEDAAMAQIEEQGSQAFDKNRLISYRMSINRVPIRLAPFEGDHLFRHSGHWILFSHRLHKTSVLDAFTQSRERGYITLRCFGRSLAPLQRLLDNAQVHSLECSRGTTKIFRGMSGVRSDRIQWQQILSRPARDIRTVILDRAKKNELLADINEYLHPHSRRWYANRGIPYRRGYLFSGAPGTGKTSLTAALAGVFGLDIYVLSLLDPALSESHLMRLLGEVPSRCIVLVEDVDAAGLVRPGGGVAGSGNAGAKDGVNVNGTPDIRQRRGGGSNRGQRDAGKPASDDVGQLLADAAGAETGASSTAAPSNISLSGLLNAIDGVSSHEGHILIMTTNNPEQLDRALVRPGRVDMHIAFQLPRKAEISALFLSMYRDLSIAPKVTGSKKGEADTDRKVKASANGISKGDVDSQSISSLEFETGPELAVLANRFADALPEETLSLATIQGYLLRYKREPEMACDRAAEWGLKAAQEVSGQEGPNAQNEAEAVLQK